MQGRPPLSALPSDIDDYIVEEEVSRDAPDAHQEKTALSTETRDRLRQMLPFLEKDIADLVCNAGPLLDLFCLLQEN